MSRITIVKKDFDVASAASEILAGIRRENLQEQWISVADMVMITGLPERKVRPGTVYLAGQEGGALRERDGTLHYRAGDIDAKNWTFRLPSWLKRFRRSLQRVLPHLRNAAAMIGTSLVITGWFVAYFAALMALFPEASNPFITTLAVAGLVGIFVATIPLQLIGLVVAMWSISFGGFVSGVVQSDLWVATGGLAMAAVSLVLTLFLGAFFHIVLRLYGHLYHRLTKTLPSIFNFGRPRRQALSAERNFLGLVSRCDGVITIGDLMALYGWTHHRAFHELTRLMLDYGGEVWVDERGRIKFDFSDLSERAGVQPATIDLRPAWEVEKPPAEVFDDRARRADVWMLALWAVATAPLVVLAVVQSSELWESLSATPTSAVLYGTGLILLVLIPLFVVCRRLLVWRRQANFDRRAAYLDWLRQADTQKGILRMEPDKVDEPFVLDLDARIDAEVDDTGRLEVIIPEFQRSSSTVTDGWSLYNN